jgi:hypothetical protein
MPVEAVIADDAPGYGVSAIGRMGNVAVCQQFGVSGPVDAAGDGPRVGVDQELRRVESLARGRVKRAVHSVAVELTRRNIREEPVPDMARATRQVDAQALRPRKLIEEAKLDAFGAPRVDGEIDAAGQDSRAEGVGVSVKHTPSSS